ncbi:hypothetical protein [Agrococcus baldri]|uniref:hypothetical protein n=1 Tax=Agrococcus baldri TaxID=153730 RepID=UPI000B8A181F|nr:hypothetical protein [Agrococcus baldri]
MDFLIWLSTVGGVCTTATAREHADARELQQMQKDGALWVPLRGWVALDGIRNDVTRSLELGGVVTCASAFGAHGLWTPHGDHDLHIRVHRETHSARLNATARKKGVRVHRLLSRLPERRPWDGVDGILTSLAVASRCLSASDVLAAADGALQQGKLQRDVLAAMSDQLPKVLSRTLARAPNFRAPARSRRSPPCCDAPASASCSSPSCFPASSPTS